MKSPSRDTSVTLHCFTPLVTLVTFFLEAFFALVALVKYRKTRFGQLSILLFLFLSLFQLSEYLICSGGDVQLWHTIGWVSITFLPMLGFGLVDELGHKHPWTRVGFFIMTAFIFAITFVPGTTLSASCTGNFVLFQNASLFSWFYALYYLGFVAAGVIRLILMLAEPRHHPATAWLLIGYLAFLLPAFLIFVFVSVVMDAFPSILCGFAVLLSLIMIAKVLPIFHQGKTRKT